VLVALRKSGRLTDVAGSLMEYVMLVIVSNEMVRSNEEKCAYLSSRIAAIEDRQGIAWRRSERSS
jgi:hypothetical protein